MDIGHFYFINDQYFIDFPDPLLMQNKETVNGVPHDRPCFYAFQDQSTGLFWMIPFSSRVPKYKTIYNSKISKGKPCDTIVFGEVLGHEKAFLIQNMCPIDARYILTEYYSNSAPVQISGALESELIQKATKVLSLQRRGIKLIFPDVLTIEAKLLSK